MAQYDLKLLDCTLRDGGYVNDWNWGFQRARDIIQEIRCFLEWQCAATMILKSFPLIPEKELK